MGGKRAIASVGDVYGGMTLSIFPIFTINVNLRNNYLFILKAIDNIQDNVL